MAIIPEQDPYIQSLHSSWYQPYVAGIDILRLDVLHPVVSGNKWYKLKYNIESAQEAGKHTLLTFGGGYSNYLIAAATAAKIFGMKSIGIVRGHYPALTPTLKACVDEGMQLVFVTQEEYNLKEDEDWLQKLSDTYGHPLIIPEGGANKEGRRGAEEIASFIPASYSHICLSAGTGTTLIGIRNALPDEQKVYGYVPMKNGSYIMDEILSYLHAGKTVQLFDDWHFGGFGKIKPELTEFMYDFYKINGIPLDRVYTAKMMYGIQAQLKQDVFPPEAKILCIHTGGLQGNDISYPKI